MRHRARRGRMAWPSWIDVVPARPRRRRDHRALDADHRLLLTFCSASLVVLFVLWGLL